MNAARACSLVRQPRGRRSRAALPRAYRASEARRGLTMIELTLSVAVLAMVAAAVAALASGVRQGSEFARDSATVTQHARVTMQRICRRIEAAWATENDPGVVVVHETLAGQTIPTALVVWLPEGGKPANLDGPPLVKELVIFAADPADPRRLLEARSPQDTTPISLEGMDSATGRSLISSILSAGNSQKVLLTELLRTTAVSNSASSGRRGVFWAARRILPSSADLSASRAGAAAWEQLPWPQGIYSSRAGLRQVWIRLELQLVPPGTSTDHMASQAMPYFGSAAIYYEVTR